VEACLDELGICFCFAPLMHPSMKHVAAVRKRLGIRTIFNILGPLVNPAGACYQLLGAGRPELRPLLAGAMARLGTKRTFVVSGEDGLGDVTLAGTTYVTEVTTSFPLPPGPNAAVAEEGRREGIREFTWQPEDFGLKRGALDSLSVNGPQASAAIIRGILAGQRGLARDIVILNAAAGLIASGMAADAELAASIAAEAIDSNAAETLLRRLVEKSHAPA
jgi:anthranilate phosphoribosyltransferase